MSYRNKLYSIFSFFVLLVLVIFFTLFLPILRSIKHESVELSNKKAEIESIQTVASGLKEFKDNYKFYKKGLEEVDDLLKQESLMDPEMPIEFINFIKAQAQELNISLKLIPLGLEDKKSQFWNYLDFRIEATGDFNSLMQFINKLEYSHWFVETMNVSFSKKGTSDSMAQQDTLNNSSRQIRLLIKVYAQKHN